MQNIFKLMIWLMAGLIQFNFFIIQLTDNWFNAERLIQNRIQVNQIDDLI